MYTCCTCKHLTAVNACLCVNLITKKMRYLSITLRFKMISNQSRADFCWYGKVRHHSCYLCVTRISGGKTPSLRKGVDEWDYVVDAVLLPRECTDRAYLCTTRLIFVQHVWASLVQHTSGNHRTVGNTRAYRYQWFGLRDFDACSSLSIFPFISLWAFSWFGVTTYVKEGPTNKLQVGWMREICWCHIIIEFMHSKSIFTGIRLLYPNGTLCRTRKEKKK